MRESQGAACADSQWRCERRNTHKHRRPWHMEPLDVFAGASLPETRYGVWVYANRRRCGELYRGFFGDLFTLQCTNQVMAVTTCRAEEHVTASIRMVQTKNRYAHAHTHTKQIHTQSSRRPSPRVRCSNMFVMQSSCFTPHQLIFKKYELIFW